MHPFHSWEKWSIENAIGLIRRFFPKKTDFDLVIKEQVKCVETFLNTKPRKCPNYRTNNEALRSGVALRCGSLNLPPFSCIFKNNLWIKNLRVPYRSNLQG
jgi:hypothetical protein